MDPLCKNPRCGLRHPAAWNCARALYEAQKALPVVVHAPEVVVHMEHVGSSRHGVYKDAEARKAYRREWMRKRRAAVSDK